MKCLQLVPHFRCARISDMLIKLLIDWQLWWKAQTIFSGKNVLWLITAWLWCGIFIRKEITVWRRFGNYQWKLVMAVDIIAPRLRAVSYFIFELQQIKSRLAIAASIKLSYVYELYLLYTFFQNGGKIHYYLIFLITGLLCFV